MKSGKKPIVDFANKLFESREKAHVFHLQSKLFSSHIALDEYYKGIIKHIDKFVEVYQGQFGIIEDYQFITNDNTEKNEIKYFENLADFIADERYNYVDEKESHLHNIIDEMVALLYQTLYKMKYLK
jgi:hypothetical protein